MTDLAAIRFDRDEWARLILVLGDDKTYVGIEPVRCFPLSDPEKSIALLDAEGHEILTLPDLDSLNPATRETLKAELAARDFVPVIRRIISTSAPAPPSKWTVETDRGQTTFELVSEDDVRKLSPNRLMIADSNGIRYIIPDTRSLDAFTQRIVQRIA